jgi:HK97 family phage portal protein
MNILDIFKRKKPQEHQEYRGISTGDYALYNQISSYKDNQALSLSAVYRCVQVISDAVAQLPIEVYKTDEHGHKREYKDSPVYRLMQRPSETMTKFTLFKTLISYVLLRGNGYVYIKRTNGQPVELQLIPPEYVTPQLENNKIIYNITGYKLPVSSKDIIHIINHSEDGYIGISTLTHARKSLQLASDSESHASGFFRGGANSAGILKIQGIVTNDQKEKIRSAWQLAFNAQNGTPNGVAVLDGNMDY